MSWCKFLDVRFWFGIFQPTISQVVSNIVLFTLCLLKIPKFTIYIYTVFLVDTTNYSSRLLPITPLQINIASEKWWLEKDFLFGSFLGSMLYFAGVHCHSITLDIHQLRLFFEPHPPRLRTPKWSSTKLQEELFKTADMFLLVVFFGINVLYLVILVM